MNLEIKAEMQEISLPDEILVDVGGMIVQLKIKDLDKAQIDLIIDNIGKRLYAMANIPKPVYRSIS